MSRINTNVPSLLAQRMLATAGRPLDDLWRPLGTATSSGLQRSSSGRRANAGDSWTTAGRPLETAGDGCAQRSPTASDRATIVNQPIYSS